MEKIDLNDGLTNLKHRLYLTNITVTQRVLALEIVNFDKKYINIVSM